MTYGWAILVVLIAIGALAYFGVLNPARFLPNSCTLFPGLACTDFRVDEDGGDPFGSITLIIRNGIGDALDMSEVKILVDGGSICIGVTLLDGDTLIAGPGADLADGALGNLTMMDCQLGSVGDRFKADVEIIYTTGTSGLQHVRTGAIVAQVEP